MDDLKVSIINKVKDDSAPVILINIDRKEDLEKIDSFFVEDEIDDYVLVGLYGYDWNRDLSPWPAKKIFRNGDDFAGGANEYLNRIINEVIPSINVKTKYYAIGGYSLAGLFALYAGYRCDVFSKIVSASGSLWYEGFIDYVKNNELSDRVDCIYLSLGDQEAKTRNPLMATVEDNTRFIYSLYKERIKSTFELNEGNHFKDANLRLYKGLKYILNT